MINRHEQAVHTKFDLIKHKVTSLDVQHEAALGAVKTRLLNIINREHAIELLDNEVLTFNDLDAVNTLNDVINVVDNYLAVTDFYEKNYSTFKWMIKEPFFHNKLRGGDLCYWNELLSSYISYKHLNSEQSTTYVLDVLAHTKHVTHSVTPVHTEANTEVIKQDMQRETEARRDLQKSIAEEKFMKMKEPLPSHEEKLKMKKRAENRVDSDNNDNKEIKYKR